ncbi:MAG TPA: heavy-metal-associated domain-containing protein [Candidatus Scatomorpha stercorigallinarum]|nr:heavy-metal-associated domain-containing protein [Candidatus Scatomorpha stercorigallinarum]
MTILNVPDMHCSKCVERITNALNAAGLKFTVSLEDKTVTIDGSAADVEKAKAELDDIGFDAT